MEKINSFNRKSKEITITKPKQISLTGDLCSGKSTTCKLLIDSLSMKLVSIGTIFRDEAEAKGISVLELNKEYEGTKNDLLLDKKIFDFRSEDSIIVDARMGWFFLPESFKVYLKTDPMEIVRRARKSNRGAVETYSSDEEAYKQLVSRKQSELDRFNNLYGVNFHNEDNFDLVVDTTTKSPSEVAEEIEKAFYNFIKNDIIKMNFNNLLPTQGIKELNNKYIESLELPIRPIDIVKVDNFYWIVDGHHRAVLCKENDIDVDCRLINSSIVDGEIRNLYDWEDEFKFRYTFYPFNK
ncbi:MAG: cytidylate kinase family protein [Anaeroplasmataceae bacterium]